MRIETVELVNFRKHTNKSFFFTEGTNVIVGKNGSGKSSIIMAIGVALFNSKPASLKSLITDGADTATVKVTFTYENVCYTVVRTFGEASHWIIAADGETIADGSEAVQVYLSNLFDADLDTMFQYVVGSQQFELSLPFLQTAKWRKQTFDAVFGVLQWEIAWENLRETGKYIREILNEYARKLEHYDKMEAEIDRLETEINRDNLRINELRLELSELDKELAKIDYDGYLELLNAYALREQEEEYKRKMREKYEADLVQANHELREADMALELLPTLYEGQDAYHKYIEDWQRYLARRDIYKLLADEFQKSDNCPVCGTLINDWHRREFLDKFNPTDTVEMVPDTSGQIAYYETCLKTVDNVKERITELERMVEQNQPMELPEYPQFNDPHYQAVRFRRDETNRSLQGVIHSATYKTGMVEGMKDQLKERLAIEASMWLMQSKLEMYDEIRDVFRELGPKLANEMRIQIETNANVFVADTMHGDPTLRWDEDYLLHIKWNDTEVPITNLSGGEQTLAALAVRVALAEQYGLLILDEPTLSLDAVCKERLIEFLNNQNFGQCIIATHYEGFSGNVVEL